MSIYFNIINSTKMGVAKLLGDNVIRGDRGDLVFINILKINVYYQLYSEIKMMVDKIT